MTQAIEGEPSELCSKALGPMEIVDDAKGEVTAVVYHLGAVDRDREVVLRDSFASGAPVRMSNYGHSTILGQAKQTGIPVEPPVGKGFLTVEGDKAVFRGRYFMSTHRGREAYATAKEMGAEQEWSFTFWIGDSEPASEEWRAKGARRVIKQIAPFEVSPVTVASSRGTHTVGIKCEGCGHLPEEPCDCQANAVAAQQVTEQPSQGELEAKAAADLETERQAQELLRAEDERVAQRMALKQAATDEFERLQRNLRRFRVA